MIAILLLNTMYHRYNRKCWIKKYSSIEINMTEQQVRSIMGDTPNFMCKYAQCKIIYYFSGGPFSDERKVLIYPEKYPKDVTEIQQIPFIYDALQILIGPDGKVRAIAWNGENAIIHTYEGNVKGSDITKIPNKMFVN
jgi:hypothetical protein